MKLIKVFLFILFIFEESIATLVEEPAGCLKTSQICAVKSVQGPLSLKISDAVFHLSLGSVLIRKNVDEYVLVQGELYVEALNKRTFVSSEYIQLESKTGGFWILKNNQNQSVVRNIESKDLKIFDRNKQKMPDLVIGFENWYAGMDSSGQQRTGILKPIEFSNYMKEHLTIASSDRIKAVQDLKNIKLKWEQSQQSVSDIYEKVAVRQLANEKKDSNHAPDHLSNQIPSESENLRNLFKKKNFIDPEMVESH